jgi:hypothetical protein
MTNTSTWKTAHEAAWEWLEMAAHDSGSDSCGGGLAALGEFGPRIAPRLLAEHLPSDPLLCFDLSASGFAWVHLCTPGQTLIEVLLVDAELIRNSFANFGCDFRFHAVYSSLKLAIYNKESAIWLVYLPSRLL